jgi:hypothetical protein
MSENRLSVREPKTVIVDRIDLWAIQKAIKYNTFMMDPQTMKPVSFPVEAGEHTALRLRSKVNALLCRFEQEPELEWLTLPLDYDEAWYIDSVINAESYKGARTLLIQVFTVIWEHENGIPVRLETINSEGPDKAMNVSEIQTYLQQLGDWSGAST